MKPFWVTFYSYKGGVGRSMALANVATLLARRSRRVLMIDFDLEAPGLDSFRELGIKSGNPGVVEYAYEFQTTQVAPDIRPFVQECKFDKHMSGKVWLMPSGRKDEQYNSKRIALNWQELYERGLGQPFVDNWKAAVLRHYKPDYVFVDSRTGLTDVGGICTLHLPDLVALLFGLNDQNLHGIEAVLRIIRDAKSGKPPQILPVATPVPNMPGDEAGPFASRLKEAETLLGLKIERMISYNPLAALVEKLFTLAEDSHTTRIGSEYNSLLRDIQRRDGGGLDSMILQAQEASEEDDQEVAKHVKDVLLQDFADRADALFEVGQIERRFSGRPQAIIYWRKAFEADPLHMPAFNALVAYYKQTDKTEDLLKLHEDRLRFAEVSGVGDLAHIRRQKGEELMALGRYDEASETYEKANDTLQDELAIAKLVFLFNKCESERRAKREINYSCWKKVIRLFEDKVNVENFGPDTQANVLQAMHVPHACLGRSEEARELLVKAEKCALLVGKVGKIFSVKTYSAVSVEEFRASNKEMMKALDANQLWDGMPLPAVL